MGGGSNKKDGTHWNSLLEQFSQIAVRPLLIKLELLMRKQTKSKPEGYIDK